MQRFLPQAFRTLAVLAALLPAASGLAQQVSKAKEGNAWIGSVVAIVLAMCVAGVSFMSSRRGHQD